MWDYSNTKKAKQTLEAAIITTPYNDIIRFSSDEQYAETNKMDFPTLIIFLLFTKSKLA